LKLVKILTNKKNEGHMVSFFIFILTSILLVVCGFAVLLILMQRPSEESGMGATLGGGAATSVFGGEAVNVLAKWTKYAVITFYVLSFVLSLLHMSKETVAKPKNLLEKKAVAITPVDVKIEEKIEENPEENIHSDVQLEENISDNIINDNIDFDDIISDENDTSNTEEPQEIVDNLS
jgi:protein translocase SecG subunit